MFTVGVTREVGIDAAVVEVGGEIDLLTADAFADVVEKLLIAPGSSTVVVDFSAVTFLDSSAIAALIDLRTVARDSADASLMLRNMPARQERLFRMTHTYDLFDWLPQQSPAD